LRTIFQGSACSAVKMVRVLGSERRDTGWSLSAVKMKKVRTLP